MVPEFISSPDMFSGITGLW